MIEPAAVVTRPEDSPEAVAAVLSALRAAEGPCVVVTAVPVTDTLKQVDDGGVLLGTADREHHRLVGTPFAAPLGALRAVRAADPTPEAVLAALVAAGLPVTPLPIT